MHKIGLTILLSLFFLSSKGYNYDSSDIRHFNVESGLPTNKVYYALQDKYGYIWFATERGVVKYNGYRLKVFNDRDGLPSSDIWNLTEDSKGRIWVTNYSTGFGYIRNDKYFQLPIKTKPGYKIVYLREFNNKVIIPYRLFNDNYLLIIDSADNTTQVKFPYAISNFQWSTDNKLYYNSIRENTFIRVTARNNSFFVKRLCISDSSNTRLNNIYFNSGKFAFGTQQGTGIITLLNMENCSTSNIHIDSLSGYKDESIKVITYNNDSVFVSGKRGFYTFTHNFSKLIPFHYNEYFQKTPNIVYKFMDRNGNTWLAGDDGVFRLPSIKLKLQPFNIINNNRHLTSVGVLEDGSICWWDNQTYYLYIVSKENIVLLKKAMKNRVYSVTDYDNKYILCTSPEGLLKLNKKDGSYSSLIGNDKRILMESSLVKYYKNSIDSSTIIGNRALLKKGHYYFTIAWHKSIFKIKDGEFLFVSPEWLGKINTAGDTIRVKSIYYERYTNFYFDKYSGDYIYSNNDVILIYRPKEDTFIHFNKTQLKQIGISNINGIKTDQNGNFFIHTNTGLIVFNTYKASYKVLRPKINLAIVKMELYNNYVILVGQSGFCYTHVDSIESDDSFFIKPFNNNQHYNLVYDFIANSLGHLYLNTDKGIYISNADSIINIHQGLNNNITTIMKLCITKPYLSALKNNDTIMLPLNENTIKFDCINYYGKGELRYKYRIKGLNSWTESNTGEVFLSSIKAENYYQVKFVVSDDVWNSRLYTFYLYKHPHWWQSATFVRIFWVLGVLMLIFTVYLIISVTRYYVNKNNEKKNRLLDLELRAVYSQINPHFIFNTLSSAQFFIDKKNFDEAYAHISKFSKLLRGYLRSSQERYVTLSHEIMMLRNYIELQQSRFVEPFQYKIEVDNKIPVDSILIPSLLLQPLVENAINHGLFHKQGEGLLLISFRQGDTNNELICTIDDNGVGRTKAAQIKEESSAPQDSYGTMLTQKLIDIFKEYENLNIYLKYIDKEAPHTGTTVVLTIRNIRYDA